MRPSIAFAAQWRSQGVGLQLSLLHREPPRSSQGVGLQLAHLHHRESSRSSSEIMKLLETPRRRRTLLHSGSLETPISNIKTNNTDISYVATPLHTLMLSSITWHQTVGATLIITNLPPFVFLIHLSSTKILITMNSPKYQYIYIFPTFPRTHNFQQLPTDILLDNIVIMQYLDNSMLPEIPTDLIIDILSRIPPKDLLCFRSVSKSWCSLIDSKEFINIHFKKSQETDSNRSIILAGLGVYVVDLDIADDYVALEMNPPVKFFEISSSIDGLFLVMSDKNDSPLIWNPSTQELVTIPSSPVEYPHGSLPGSAYETYGFGFDSNNEDFKVVKSVKCKGFDYSWMNCETKVYSVKQNSWKKIDDFAYPLPHKRIWGVHVKGALHCHFVMPESELTIIMAFDVGTEKHYVMPSPDLPEEEKLETLSLAEIGGCLSVVNPIKRCRYDVWVMKEYGVEKSWMKLFSVSSSLVDCNVLLYPLGYSRCGREVLLNCDDTKLVWYDLEKKTVEGVRVHNMPYVFSAMPFVASLVQLWGCSRNHDKVKTVGRFNN